MYLNIDLSIGMTGKFKSSTSLSWLCYSPTNWPSAFILSIISLMQFCPNYKLLANSLSLSCNSFCFISYTKSGLKLSPLLNIKKGSSIGLYSRYRAFFIYWCLMFSEQCIHISIDGGGAMANRGASLFSCLNFSSQYSIEKEKTLL
jgi:hypothetical protein